MEIHQRTMRVQKAEAQIALELIELAHSIGADYKTLVDAAAQMMMNLSRGESERLVVNDYQRQGEKILVEHVSKHELTYGETVMALSGFISTNMKYLIRRERHGSEDKAGDEA